MQDLPLDAMSAKELRELRDLVDQAIAIVTQKEKAELVARMAELAAQHGLSLADLAEASSSAQASAHMPVPHKSPAKPRRAKSPRQTG